MAAFSLPKFEFISAALQGKVSREKGGVGRTSSLLTFPCNAAEINSDFGSENAAMVLKSMKRVGIVLLFFTTVHKIITLSTAP